MTYGSENENGYEPDSDERFLGLIRSVCRAYRAGELSENVKIIGLITCQDMNIDDHCKWKNISHPHYRDDVSCQTCDMICASIPPLQVLEFDNFCTPCIKCENRVRIVQFRDELGFKQNLTKALLSQLLEKCGTPVFCPPDFATSSHALFYEEYQFERTVMD